jgi:hypothetical protein
VDDFPMTLYSGPIPDRKTVSFPDLQNFTNFNHMPWRDVLEGWPVFHKMAELDDMVQYIPTEEEKQCTIERIFDNDVMEVTCAVEEECKGNSSNDDDAMEDPKLERTLDAIFHHDDGDETNLLI